MDDNAPVCLEVNNNLVMLDQQHKRKVLRSCRRRFSLPPDRQWEDIWQDAMLKLHDRWSADGIPEVENWHAFMVRILELGWHEAWRGFGGMVRGLKLHHFESAAASTTTGERTQRMVEVVQQEYRCWSPYRQAVFDYVVENLRYGDQSSTAGAASVSKRLGRPVTRVQFDAQLTSLRDALWRALRKAGLVDGERPRLPRRRFRAA